ncbi:hypothetical protein [Streptomyces chrestomyceticus]|uniref:hypothetical protein n=1 Tax=Streptomyces chrestomyceticus TaxID=68185 RepID=UPI001FD0B88D|nr:hypothetical protein [Streptomyces chrestomyceticus]
MQRLGRAVVEGGGDRPPYGGAGPGGQDPGDLDAVVVRGRLDGTGFQERGGGVRGVALQCLLRRFGDGRAGDLGQVENGLAVVLPLRDDPVAFEG